MSENPLNTAPCSLPQSSKRTRPGTALVKSGKSSTSNPALVDTSFKMKEDIPAGAYGD